jgi:hypothetical protein
MEDNHLGGQNHVPGIWAPFCGQDHKQFHVNCRRAGVDLTYTPNRSLGLIQALKAMLVGMWMVVESCEKHIKSQSEAQSDGTHQEERSNKESSADNFEDATSNGKVQQ